MIAGRLKYRLRLFRPARTSDSFGEQGAGADGFAFSAEVWAERVKFSSSRRMQAAEEFSDYRVEYRIRAAHRVEEGWRVEQLGGKLYDVAGIEPNRARGYVTLICERVNQ